LKSPPGSRRATALVAASAGLLIAASAAPDFDPWRDSAIHETEHSVDLERGTGRSDVRHWNPVSSRETDG